MNQVQVILTIDLDNLPDNFSEILIHEKEIIEKWKEEEILENLFLRPTKNGAILIFKNINEEEVKLKIKELPLYPLRKSIEFYSLIKQF